MGLRTHVSIAVRDTVINKMLASSLVPIGWRPFLMNSLGHRVESDAVIHPHCFFGARTGVTMGRAVHMNRGCVIDLGAPVHFADHVMVGMEVMILTVSHELGGPELRCGQLFVKPVDIGEGTWIGARVTILPGVTIGEGCVIATGSVVTADCESNHVYGGVPAKKIKALPIESKT